MKNKADVSKPVWKKPTVRDLILSCIRKWMDIATGENHGAATAEIRCALCHRYLNHANANRCGGCPLFENGFGCLEDDSNFNKYCDLSEHLPWTEEYSEQQFECARIMVDHLNICLETEANNSDEKRS